MADVKKLNKTPFYFWECPIDSPNLSLAFTYCDSDFFIYKIETIPKIQGSTNLNEDYISYIIKQKIFFEGLSSTVLSAEKFLKGAFEVRLENNPLSRTIETFVILKLCLLNDRVYDTEKYKLQFENLFPTEYELAEIINQDEKFRILSLNGKKVIEIIKSPKFLPIGKITTNAPISNQNLEMNERELVSCRIPYVATIEPKINGLDNFYKALQECEEQVMVRFSISVCEIHNIEKIIAQAFELQISKGFNHSDGTNYFATFTKYVTAENLFSLKMQVACGNILRAKSIANTFCGQLSNTGLGSNIIYKSFSLEKDEKEANNDWSFCNHYYFDFWEYGNHLPALDIKAFMTRLPYLYNNVEYLVPFRIPFSLPEGLPGMITKPIKPFYQPNLEKQERENELISLGKILGSGRKAESQLDYKIPIKDLTKHGLIVGATGSGKTNTTLNFIQELTKHGIPFLLIEPVKSEYYDDLSPYFASGKLNRFNFKKPFLEDGTINLNYLRFNPLIPIPGISVIQHISYIKGCFNAAFPMHGIMPMILEECLSLVYSRLIGYTEKMMFDANQSPKYIHNIDKNLLNEKQIEQLDFLSLNSFKEVIDNYLNDDELFTEEDRTSFGTYLKRRIEKLTKGVLGNAFCPELWIDADNAPVCIQNNLVKMLTEPTIIELEDLADNDEKALVMAFIMTYLFEYRQTKPSIKSIELKEKENFDITNHIHITVIEEAHRLLSSGSVSAVGGGENGIVTQDSKSKSISLFIDMLAEIRAKGEGIFIVEQIPTKLVSDVIKNTNLKIMHRITSKDDRHYLGEAMNMNEQQKNYVNNLKTGEAIIFEEQLDNPVFVKMNRFI